MRTIFSQDRPLSRRAFLAGTGALVVAIGTPRLLNPKAAFARLEDDFPIGPASIDPAQIDSWVAIGGDGIVTIFTGKEEQGTGVGDGPAAGRCRRARRAAEQAPTDHLGYDADARPGL